ncbi:MAG: hypothetical protein RIT81_03145 [Deltaproteobacteria bacterium]
MAVRLRSLFVLALAGCGSAEVIALEAPSRDGDVLAPHDAGPRDGDSRDAGPCYDWASVQPIFADACATLCHSNPPRFSAPIALVTYADFQRINHGDRVYEQVAFRITAPSGRMPPATHRRQLASHEIERIEQWVAADAPFDCLD